MDPPPPSPPTAVEELFARFLEQVEAGEVGDFEALCRRHPDAATSLRRMHVRWQAMTSAFRELSTGAGEAPPQTSAPALEALMTRIGAAGARLARYAIGPELARGSMGRVVQAWDEELRREVALKIHRGGQSDGRMRRRFLEEAQIAAQLDHPGIVPIHELGLDESGRPFFSMKLVRGRHLGEILELARHGDGEWTRTRVLHVLLRVCEAMAFAHDKGVVHRDLKPANIMVGRFGETYVMDWGLAHATGGRRDQAGEGDIASLRADIEGSGEPSPLLTHSGDVIGTPAYMAPEQAAGDSGVATPAIDVYALGAILYHLLAGHVPYGEAGMPGVDELLRRVRSQPPRRLPDATPPELRAICERAMARAPADRYPDMSALADDLRAFLEVRTVRAYATGRFAELRKWVARNRGLAASSVALLLAMTVGAIAVTGLWLRAEGNRKRADANAGQLQTELDRSAFRSARLALQLDDSIEAGDAMWRAHLAGRMPRATYWALVELMERDPYLTTLARHDDHQPVAFAAGIDAALVAGSDGRLEVRDPDTLALVATIGTPGAAIGCLAASAGQPLAFAGNAVGELIVYDLAAKREHRRVAAHSDAVRCIAVGGDDSFVTGGADGRLLRWSDRDALPADMMRQDARISAVCITPENDGYMAGDVSGKIVGRAFDGSWNIRLDVNAQVTALASGARSNELFVGSTDHSLRLYDFSDGSRNWWRPTRNGTCRQLARDRDGSLFAGGWWRIGHVTSAGTMLPPAGLRGISKMAFDAQRRRLLTSGETCGLGIVDVSTHDRRHLDGGGMALSGDGRRLARVEGDRVVVGDVDGNTVVRRSGPGTVGSLALDASGSLIAITTGRSVHVAETTSGAHRFTAAGPADNPFGASCVFSPDGAEIAICAGRDRITRRRSSDGQLIAEYAFPGSRTTRIVYAADGSRLAVIGRDDGVVRVYHLADGRREDVAFDRRLPTGTETSLSAVALSPDGRRVAVGTWTGGIMVREPDGSTTSIPAHEGTIWSLQFGRHDPGLLISSGGSSGISFWDLDSAECCYHLLRDGAGQVQVSDDGRTLACQLTDGILLLDLTYRDRHIAGNLDYQLERQRRRAAVAPAREGQLRQWASEVLARPWPRWR